MRATLLLVTCLLPALGSAGCSKAGRSGAPGDAAPAPASAPAPELVLTLELTREERSKDSNGDREKFTVQGRTLAYEYEYTGYHPDEDFERERKARCVLDEAELARLLRELGASEYRRNAEASAAAERLGEGLRTTFHAELHLALEGAESTQVAGGRRDILEDHTYTRLGGLRSLLLHLRDAAAERGGCE